MAAPRRLLLAFCFVAASSGCVQDVTQRPSTSYTLEVEAQQLVFAVGQERAVGFMAQGKGEALSVGDLEVTSSDEAVVAVLNAPNQSQSIVLSGRSPGEATLSVSIKGSPTEQASVRVTVQDYDAIEATDSGAQVLRGSTLEFELLPTRNGAQTSWAPQEVSSLRPSIAVEQAPFDAANERVVNVSQVVRPDKLVFEVDALAQGRATLNIEQGGVQTQWIVDVRTPAGAVAEPSTLYMRPAGPPEQVSVVVLDERGEPLPDALKQQVCPDASAGASTSAWAKQGSHSWEVSPSSRPVREIVGLSCGQMNAFVDVVVDGGLDVHTGSFHTCATRPTAQALEAKCVGANPYGQLGVAPPSGIEKDDLVYEPIEPALPAGEVLQRVVTKREAQCAVTTSGKLLCAGHLGLSTGQLPTQSAAVWQTFEHPEGAEWSRVDMGESHMCAIDDSHRMYCWGVNHRGQLGDGTQVSSAEPVAVEGDIRWEEVFLGRDRTCGLTRLRKLWCWGSNAYNVVDPVNGGTGERLTPQPLNFDEDVISVSVGDSHLCTLNAQSQLRCWGSNVFGQLGPDGSEDVPRYEQIVVPPDGASGWSSLAVGDFTTCGVTADRAVFCWGTSTYGLLGLENRDGQPYPLRVARTPRQLSVFGGVITRMSMGPEHACLIQDINGTPTIKCWGHAAHHRTGVFGSGLTSNLAAKVPDRADSIESATLYASYGCVITDKMDGSKTNVRCFGENLQGRAGSLEFNQIVPEPEPVEADEDIAFAQINASFSQVCGVDDRQRGWCWGASRYCSLASCDAQGIDDPNIRTTPVRIQGSWRELHAGYYSGCGISSDDDMVRCWGDNSFNQVTARADDNLSAIGRKIQPSPVLLKDSAGADWQQPVTHLAVARLSACAIVQGAAAPAEVYCWGRGLSKQSAGALRELTHVTNYGQLPGAVLQLSAGREHYCALVEITDARNEVYCWGDGRRGQVDGAYRTMTTPLKVELGEAAPMHVAAGGLHSCAVVSSADSAAPSVTCWGDNRHQQRGVTLTGAPAAPAAMNIPRGGPAVFEAQEVFASARQTCVRSVNDTGQGRLDCWGSRTHHQSASDSSVVAPTGLVTDPRVLRLFAP